MGNGHPRDAELGGAGIAKGRETGRMLLLQHLSAAARQRRPRAREQQLPQALLQPGTATRAVVGGLEGPLG